MSAALITMPVRFIRQYAGSLDFDEYFETTSARMTYLSSPRRWAGMEVADAETGKRYILNSTKDAWKQVYTEEDFIFSDYVLKAGDTMTGNLLMQGGASVDSIATGGSDVLNIGTANADIINIGYSSSVINIMGTLLYQNVDNLAVKDKLIRLNVGGSAGSGISSGFEIEEGGTITGWFSTNSSRDGWDMKAPGSFQMTLGLDLLTANRIIKAPNQSGTIALLSDLTSGYVPLSRSLTINGQSQTLAVDRTWTITITPVLNRTSVTGGAGLTPTIDIAATYVGQASITTLGTITTGTWTGTPIANAYLANNTISGVALGGTLYTLTFGTHLTGTSYNGSAAVTIGTDATSANTAGTIVARDGSGNFAAGVITASLSGNALTATALQTARTINGVSFDGTSNITITAVVPNALTVSSGLQLNSGTTFDGSAARTISIATGGVSNAMLANSVITLGTTAMTLGNAYTTIVGLLSVTSTSFVGALTGNASTATALATGRTISITGDLSYTSPAFDGSGNVTAAGTLASIITAAGPIGSATVTPIITFDAKGRLTVVSSATIAPAASSITGGAALSKVDDTNVTLTLGGSPTTALLAATSLTLGWTGTLADGRIASATNWNTAYNRSGTSLSFTASTFTFTKQDASTLTVSVPTFNQNTTGSAGSVANSATFNNGGSGAASGSAFNGSAALIISYNTIGAPSSTGSGASGTWGISITGNAATATLAANSTLWNGQTYSGTTQTSINTYILGYSSAGDWRPSTAGAVQAFLGLGSMAYASTGSYLPIVGGNITTYDLTTSTGQGRFGGWYVGGGYTGGATEVGFSGGQGNVIAYNRSTNAYQQLNIRGSLLTLSGDNNNVYISSGNDLIIDDGNKSLRVRYSTGSATYHSSLNWYGLQLGNNGPNYIIAGRSSTGGDLRFYVNNTADFTTINGTLTALMDTSGNTTFYGLVYGQRFVSNTAQGVFFNAQSGGAQWQIGSDSAVSSGTGMYIYNSSGGYAFKLSPGGTITATNYSGNFAGYAATDYLSKQGGSYYEAGTAWIRWQTGGNHVGLYWTGVNNTPGYTQIYPNQGLTATYGLFQVEGYKSSYGGWMWYNTGSSHYTVSDMFDTSGNGGNYDQGQGKWHFYWSATLECLSLGGSTGVAGYKAATNGNHHVSGYLYTPTVYYETSLLYNSNTSFGIIGPNAYFDTVNGTGSDSLELNYYAGGQVICGVGTTAGYGSQTYSGTKNIGAAQFIANDGFKSVNEKGMCGDYDANGTTSKVIWSIGTQWNSVSALYGLGYSFGAYWGSTHEIVIRQAGSLGHSFGMGGDAYHGGSLRVQGASLLYGNVTMQANSIGLAIRSASYNIGHIGGAYNTADWSAAATGGDFVVARNGTSGYSGTHLILSNQNNGYIKFAFGSSSTTPDDVVKAYFTTDGWLYAYHFSETSDKRFKVERDPKPLFKGIEKLSARLYEKNGRLEVGYYAQDVLKLGIIDHAVSKDINGVYALSYAEVHTAKIARLEERVLELEKQVEKLGGNI